MKNILAGLKGLTAAIRGNEHKKLHRDRDTALCAACNGLDDAIDEEAVKKPAKKKAATKKRKAQA